MEITVLGSGTSYGVPSINCTCPVCTSPDPRDNRTRASIWIKNEDTSVVIDTSTDFRQQALREKIHKVDGLLITHGHADHIHGLDDIRPYTFKNAIPVYGNTPTLAELRERFGYIFKKTQRGGGKPKILLNVLTEEHLNQGAAVNIKSMSFLPIPLKHGGLDTLGYRIDNFAYLTDCNNIPDSSMEKLRGVEYLIVDALRYRTHPTHFTIPEAIAEAKRIGAIKVWFTHLCHDVLHKDLEQELPSGYAPAYDGLKITV